MKKWILTIFAPILVFAALINVCPDGCNCKKGSAKDAQAEYYTIVDSKSETPLFYRSGDISRGDQYISSDNKLYEIVEVDSKTMQGKAEFRENVTLPVVIIDENDISNGVKQASAATQKIVGLYHTHNDESYLVGDGKDSVYGRGGIHDIGARLKKELEAKGITAIHDETMHLPHNSGAYTRSESTAKRLLDKGATALFDCHRDSTPRDFFVTKVHGEEMTSVRLVIGAASTKAPANRAFALAIKAYADTVYPNLIKDIFVGKGNYNQHLSEKIALFEFGSEKVEKDLVLKATKPLAATINAVVFGNSVQEEQSNNAATDPNASTSNDTNNMGNNASGTSETTAAGAATSRASLDALWITLGALAYVTALFLIAYFTSEKARYQIKRFFSETLAGLFGKKKPDRKI